MDTKLEQIAVKAVNQLPKSVGAGNPHATFYGNRGRAIASVPPLREMTPSTLDALRSTQLWQSRPSSPTCHTAVPVIMPSA
jgi:hypothetical protein